MGRCIACVPKFLLLHCRSSELVKTFAEDAYSVALHPSGLTILLGFADKLRLMTVLMDDFRYPPLPPSRPLP